MGRITIFSADGCPHSLRTAAALTKYSIPFTEISVTKYPKKREDMLALSNRLATPQVFFNTRHIGGADETIELLEQWNVDKSRSSSPLGRYRDEIETQSDPFNVRFDVPDYPPMVTEPGPSRGEAEYSVLLPNCGRSTVLEVTEILKKILPLDNRTYNMTEYRNSFTGKQAVLSIMAHFKICEEKAFIFATRLKDSHIIHHVTEIHAFENSDRYFYRLACHQTPEVLNSYCTWTEQVDPNSMRLFGRLLELINTIESAVTDSKGQVNYKGAHMSSLYPVFEEAVCELQGVDLSAMDKNTLTAFGINLYNLMIKYAFMKVGIGSSDFARHAFFSSVTFDVGGYIFSFQDWENGILRGNRKAPYALSQPFTKKDSRYLFVISEPDCRIHFALNCGARSCPPVNQFTAEQIDEELAIVAYSFCEGDENVLIDPKKRQVHLSKIFSWYRVDFAGSNNELPQKLVDCLRGVKKQTLERMMEGHESIKVIFNSYDWSANASEFVPFNADALKANKRSVVKSLLPVRKQSKNEVQRIATAL